MAVIQTFGYHTNFHPHIHVLFTEEGTALDGTFHHISGFHDDVIQELFIHEVFSLPIRKKLIGLALVQKILNWHHTGFNVHNRVRAQTRKETERVGKYQDPRPTAFEADRPPQPHIAHQELLIAAEERGEYL